MSLQRAFVDQADSCKRLGSPLMHRVLCILAERWDADTALGREMATYRGDLGPAGQSLPLRIASGLHALVLEGRDAALVASYPPHDVDDVALATALLGAIQRHDAFLCNWTKRPPQTNEVRRSAVLIAMAHVAVSHFNRPIALSELGASAGLNMMWDRFVLDIAPHTYGPKTAPVTLIPKWSGAAPPEVYPQIVDRLGCDLNPLNLKNSDDMLRLAAHVWADQPKRLALTRAAASVTTAQVQRSDVVPWLAARLTSIPGGHMHIIQHSVAWQYFPEEAQHKCTALIEASGARASADSPVAWMQMETDGHTKGAAGAALTLRLWPGDMRLNLGRADFHGRWVHWAGTEDMYPNGEIGS